MNRLGRIRRILIALAIISVPRLAVAQSGERFHFSGFADASVAAEFDPTGLAAWGVDEIEIDFIGRIFGPLAFRTDLNVFPSGRLAFDHRLVEQLRVDGVFGGRSGGAFFGTGRMNAPIGSEPLDANDSRFSSHSQLFDRVPHTLDGALVGYRSRSVTIAAWGSGDVDELFDFSAPLAGARLQYGDRDWHIGVSAAGGLSGSEQPPITDIDLVAELGVVTLVAEGVAHFDGGLVLWGALAAAELHTSRETSLALRWDWLRAVASDSMSGTVAFNYRPIEYVSARLEGRADFDEQRAPNFRTEFQLVAGF